MIDTITIAGGGLSGLAMGIGLRMHDVPVTIMESGSYPRHRVCGEFLTSVPVGLLDRLNLSGCFEGAHSHRSTMWFHRGRSVRTDTLPVPAIGISRYALDDRMARRFRALGGILREHCPAPDTEEPGWVQATGRRPHKGGFIGMKGHWRNLHTRADLELHLGNRAYMGISRVEDGYVNACGLFRRIASGRFRSPEERSHATLHEHGLGYLSERLNKAELRGGSLCSVSGLCYGTNPLSNGAALGDRFQMIPPFTGGGMGIALQSAEIAVPYLVDFARGRCGWDNYCQRSKDAMKRRFSRQCSVAERFHPIIYSPLVQRLLVQLSNFRLLPFRALYSLMLKN